MRKSIVLVTAAMLVLLLSGSAYAWGPTTHTYISDQVLNDPRLANSNIAQLIKANRQCYDAGYMVTDITVAYYFTTGANYEATHSWRWESSMLSTAKDDCERAFAYGIAAHLIQDSISHNSYVPDKIRQTLIPNFPEHLIAEGAVEAHIIRDDPAAFEEMRHSMDILYSTRPDLLQKAQDQIYASTGIVLDVKANAAFLKEATATPDGFYTKYFALPAIYQTFSEGDLSVAIILAIIGIGLAVLNYFRLKKKGSMFSFSWIPIVIIIALAYFFLSGGIAGLTNISDSDAYMKQSIDRTVEIFQPNGWNTRFTYDPTGFAQIQQADSQVIVIDIGVIAFLVIAYLVYRRFIKKKKK